MKRVLIASMVALVALFTLAVSAFAWQSDIQGRPASFQAGATGGYYVWSDGDGLHVRTTDPENIESWYTGTITTDGVFRNVTLVRAEKDDSVRVIGDHELTFRMHTFSGIDGFNFHIEGGAGMTLDLSRDGHQTSPDHIFLGEDSVHPSSDPFSVTR